MALLERMEDRRLLHGDLTPAQDAASHVADVHVPWMFPRRELPPVEPPTPTPTPTPNFTQVAWSQRAPSPINRSESLTATIDGKLYVFGGFSGNLGPVIRSDVYDPATNAWTQIADLPERLTHTGVTVVGRDVYFAGGYVGPAGQTGYNQVFGTASVYRYNVDGNFFAAITSLPLPRAGGSLVAVGRNLHYFGGYNLDRTDSAAHYVLDLDDQSAGWVAAAPMPLSRNHMGAVNFDGRIYAIAGQTGTDQGLVTEDEVQTYDPETGLWSVAAPIPRAVSHVSSSTFVMGDRIIVAGGESANLVATARVYAFDPGANAWAALTSLPAARYSGVGTAIGGNLYFATGGGTSATYLGLPDA